MLFLANKNVNVYFDLANNTLSLDIYHWGIGGPYCLFGNYLYLHYFELHKKNKNHNYRVLLKNVNHHTHLKDRSDEDIFNILFKTDITPTEEIQNLINKNVPCWPQHHLTLKNLKNIEENLKIYNYIYRPSEIQEKLYCKILNKYNLDLENTLAVVIRATDKGKEVKLASCVEWLDYTEKMLKKYNLSKVLIQTDQTQIKEAFLSKFKKSCIFFEEMPTTTTANVMHSEATQKTNFMRHLDVVVRILANCKHLINHTGNMACAIMHYRNNKNLNTVSVLDGYGKFNELTHV